MLIALFAVAGITALGSVVLFLVAVGLLLARRVEPGPLLSNRLEVGILALAAVAAVVGSALLFTFPVSSGNSTTVSSSIGGESTVVTRETEHSFYEAGGPRFIPFFTVPIAFTLLPFLVGRWRGRALVAAGAAFLLAFMSAFGMSGFGTFFAPAGLLVLLSGFMALRRHGV